MTNNFLESKCLNQCITKSGLLLTSTVHWLNQNPAVDTIQTRSWHTYPLTVIPPCAWVLMALACKGTAIGKPPEARACWKSKRKKAQQLEEESPLPCKSSFHGREWFHFFLNIVHSQDLTITSPYCLPHNCYDSSLQNLSLDQLIVSIIDVFLILTAFLHEIVLIIQGEILPWSLLVKIKRFTHRQSTMNLPELDSIPYVRQIIICMNKPFCVTNLREINYPTTNYTMGKLKAAWSSCCCYLR